MNYHKSEDRLSILYALLQSDYYDFTIQAVSQDLSLPLAVLRQDCAVLFASPELKFHIFDSTDPSLSLESDIFTDNLSNGCYDDHIFELSINVPLFPKGFYLPVDELEYGVISDRFQKLLDGNHLPVNFYTKHTIYDSPFEKRISQRFAMIALRDALFKINEAIQDKRIISFDYLTAQGEKQHKYTIPQNIFHDANENLYYCIDYSGRTFRLDRMNSVQLRKKTAIDKIQTDQMDYVWGAEAADSDPIHVKFKVIDQTSNLLSKIDRETKHRKYRMLYQDQNNMWIYEDDIIGINSFCRWLRSFGSSIVVLSPDSIVKRMKESAQKILENYGADIVP